MNVKRKKPWSLCCKPSFLVALLDATYNGSIQATDRILAARNL